jgi:predicted Na+-dependent transporter
MADFLANLLQVVTPAFAITTMLAMGMRLTISELVEPLRNWRFVAAALILSFLFVPAAAWVIAAALRLTEDIRIGLILLGCVAGAPMIPKLVTIAKGDTASAVAMVTLLVVATVVVAPLTLPVLLPGVEVDVVAIAVNLSWQMLLPLGAGLFVSERYPEEATEYVDEVGTISNIALVLLFVASLGQNMGGLLEMFGNGAIVATFLLLLAAIVGGYASGVPAGVERRLLALGTAQRNVAAAFIIATGNFADRPTVATFMAAAGLVSMLVLFPLAGEWSKRPRRVTDVGDLDPARESHGAGA